MKKVEQFSMDLVAVSKNQQKTRKFSDFDRKYNAIHIGHKALYCYNNFLYKKNELISMLLSNGKITKQEAFLEML